MPIASLVIAVLHTDGKDKDYGLYCDAYGLEMQIDPEWDAEAVLLVPSGHLRAVTKGTGVTDLNMRIVSAGVTDVPVTPTGTPDLSEIADERNNWLLVAGPGNADPEKMIRTKLQAALNAGYRAILCYSEFRTAQFLGYLEGIEGAALGRLIVACIGPDATQPSMAKVVTHFVHEGLRSVVGTSQGARVVVGGRMTASEAVALSAIPGIAGVFLPVGQYRDFCDILEILTAVGTQHRK
jgi:hypothetical protein